MYKRLAELVREKIGEAQAALNDLANEMSAARDKVEQLKADFERLGELMRGKPKAIPGSVVRPVGTPPIATNAPGPNRLSKWRGPILETLGDGELTLKCLLKRLSGVPPSGSATIFQSLQALERRGLVTRRREGREDVWRRVTAPDAVLGERIVGEEKTA
jgi:hypothetical protein